MKVLLTAEGTEGDIRPLIALGIGLRARGHEVTACVPPDFVESVRSHDIGVHPMGMSVQEFFRLNAAVMNAHALGVMRPMLAAFDAVLRDQFAAMERHGPGHDLIIAGGLQFAAASVASKNGIRFLHAVHTPMIASSGSYAPPLTHLVNLPGVLNRLLWYIHNRSMDLFLKGKIDRHRLRLGLEPIESVEKFYCRSMVLAMDAPLIPLPADTPPFALPQIPYWPLHEPAPQDTALERFIRSGPPPVHIGFGSMSDDTAHHTIAIISEAVRRAEVRAVVSRGWARFNPALQADERILLVDRLPHTAIFPHMAAIVHHGGAGTTHSAAYSGVPQLIVPHMLDQFYTAHRIHSLRLGPRPIRRTRLTAPALAAALRDTLDNREYAEAARTMGEQLRTTDGVAAGIAQIEAWLSR